MFASLLAGFLAVSGPLLALGGLNGTVTGHVVASDGTNVGGADVILSAPSGTRRVTTGKDGRFSLLGVPADTYVVKVDKPGFYELEQSDVVVNGDAETPLGDLKIAQAGANDQGGTPVPQPQAK